MNYKKIYQDLIERSKSRPLPPMFEKHHIVPRCMGGVDNEENLVCLTPEEHYLAHQLLVKIYPNNDSLVYAAQMMVPRRPNNKMYGWLKRRFKESASRKNLGDKNSQYGTAWITDGLNNKKIHKNEKIPVGWKKGRFFKKSSEKINELEKKKKEIEERRKLRLENDDNERRKLALSSWNKYLNGDWKSSVEFARDNKLYCQENWCRLWKKHVPNYTEVSKRRSSIKILMESKPSRR